MGDINRALGGGSELEFDGKVYKLSPWTYKIQSDYERYLEREAYAALKRLRTVMGSEEFSDQLHRLQQDIAVGAYSFGSELVAKSFTALPHLKQLVYLMMLPNHPEITREVVDKIVDKMFEEILQKVADANVDPMNSEMKETLTPR